MGRQPDVPGGEGPRAPQPLAPPSGSRRLKLSSILDPTLDAEVQQLPESEVAQMYTQYKATFTTESDVSKDQLSALAQVLSSKAVPFADFYRCSDRTVRDC